MRKGWSPWVRILKMIVLWCFRASVEVTARKVESGEPVNGWPKKAWKFSEGGEFGRDVRVSDWTLEWKRNVKLAHSDRFSDSLRAWSPPAEWSSCCSIPSTVRRSCCSSATCSGDSRDRRRWLACLFGRQHRRYWMRSCSIPLIFHRFSSRWHSLLTATSSLESRFVSGFGGWYVHVLACATLSSSLVTTSAISSTYASAVLTGEVTVTVGVAHFRTTTGWFSGCYVMLIRMRSGLVDGILPSLVQAASLACNSGKVLRASVASTKRHGARLAVSQRYNVYIH